MADQEAIHVHEYQPSPLVCNLSVAFEGIGTRGIHLELCECGAVRVPPDYAKRIVGKQEVSSFS